MTYTRKVAYNTLAQIVGKFAGVAVSLVTTAILFRYFGVEGMGKYTTVFAYVAFFGVLSDMGLQWTFVRELAINPDHEKVYKNVFALRIVLALIMHALSFALVWFFKYPLEVKLGVGVINLAWFFTTINMAQVGVFLQNYRLDISTLGEVLGRVLVLAIVFLMSKTNASFYLVMSAYIFGNILNFLFNLTMVRRYISLGLKFDFKYWRYIFYQAVPIGIVLVFGFVYYKIDSLMISWLKGMTDVGIYGTAYKLLEVLQTLPSMFLGAAFPLVTRYIATKDERVGSAFQKQFDFLSLIAIPLVIGTFILAGEIISFIAGSRSAEFTSSSTVIFFGRSITSVVCLKILIFSVGISFFSNLYSYLIVSLGRQKSMVLPMIGFAAFNVLLNLILIPRISYLGASIATLSTELMVLTVFYFVSKHFRHLPIRLEGALKTLLAGLIMGASIYFFNILGLNLILNIVFAVAIYCALIFAFGAVRMDMIRQIMGREP